MVLMSAMNQCYWIIGSVTGNLIGNIIPFDTTGIDFAMTALFVVIFTEQWLAADSPYSNLYRSLLRCHLSDYLWTGQFLFLPSLILAVALLSGWTVKTEKADEKEPREKGGE